MMSPGSRPIGKLVRSSRTKMSPSTARISPKIINILPRPAIDHSAVPITQSTDDVRSLQRDHSDFTVCDLASCPCDGRRNGKPDSYITLPGRGACKFDRWLQAGATSTSMRRIFAVKPSMKELKVSLRTRAFSPSLHFLNQKLCSLQRPTK